MGTSLAMIAFFGMFYLFCKATGLFMSDAYKDQLREEKERRRAIERSKPIKWYFKPDGKELTLGIAFVNLLIRMLAIAGCITFVILACFIASAIRG